MGEVIQHKDLRSDWEHQSLAFQMGNIGSEVSRALKNVNRPARFKGAYERALELFDFTIDAAAKRQDRGALKEVCRAREEFCDYFEGNSFGTNPEAMQRYYDQFAMLSKQ